MLRRPTHKTRWARVSRMALAGVLALCVALACAACESSAAPPPKIGYDCGTVRIAGGPDPTGPAKCLLDHYTHCETATLVYFMMGVDTSETHTLSVKPQGSACAIADADVYYSAVFNKTTRQDYQCSGVRQGQGPLTLTSSGPQHVPGAVVIVGCGQEGDVMLPALPPPSTPLLVGTSCGWVRVATGHVMSDPSGPETCLWHSYTTCQPATLDFDGDATSPMPGNALVLTVLPQGSACALYIQVTDLQLLNLTSRQNLFTCTALVRQHNGLAAPDCTEVGGGFSFGVFLPAK